MRLEMQMHVTGLRDVVALCDALSLIRNVVGLGAKPRGVALVRAYFAGSSDAEVRRLAECARGVYMIARAVKEGRLVEDS